MGKSKFPGKPSRLVNKKRVSVLSGAGLSTLASGCSSDEDNNQHQENSSSTTTTEKLNHQQQSPIHSQHQQQQQQQQKQNQQQQQPSPKASTLLDNEEIDQDGDEDVSKHADDDSDNSDDDEEDEEDESSSGYSDEDNDEVADLAASQPSTGEAKDEHGDECPAVSPATVADSKPQDKPSATGNSFEMKPSSLSAVAGAVSSQSAAESVVSQSSPATMAEGSKSTSGEQPSEGAAQASEAPPKPKKKSVTFHSTLETTDENVVKKVYNPASQPLTPIIKRECLAHPIRLTKSYNRKMKKRKQRLAMLAAASKPECIVRPSRLTEVILKSSKLDDATPPPTTSLVAPSAFSDPLAIASETPEATATSSSSEERNLESGGTQFGDKRFILPKRSAHSSRVIKPNKRFLDEFELEIKKKNKNLAAAQAAAAAAASASTSTAADVAVGSAAGNGSGSGSSATMGDGFGDKLFKSDVMSSKSDEDSDRKEGESGEGEEGKKKKEKIKKDSEEQSRRIGKLGEKDAPSDPSDGPSESTPARPASSISINNPFAKTSLLDAVSGTSGSCTSSSGTTLKLMKPAVLLSAATASTSSSLASATSIFGKSILRQPRLQFTTSLLNSNPLASDGGSGGAAPERTTVSDGPFSLHLKAGTELDSSKIFSSALTASGGTSEGTPSGASGAVGPSCSICGIADSGRHHQAGTEKHGIGCHTCRKFISMIKKRTKGPNPCGVLKCKNDSKCSVKTMVRPSHVRSNHIFKERCHVCWVRRCLTGFPLPPSLKTTLTQILPPMSRQVDSTAPASSTSVKKESSIENNIFSNSLSSGLPTVAAPRILWNTSTERSEFPKTSSFPSLSNPLAQNNSTFGSLPPIKLNISDKPLILAPSSLGSPKIAKEEIPAAPTVEKNLQEPEPVASTTNPDVTTKVLRPRNKAEPATPTPTSTNTASVSSPPPVVTTTATVVSPTATTTTSTAAVTADAARQRIDLKGPRVKHVCRSASIVLGQPLAMFPDDEAAAVDATLENIETPPSDSAAEGADDVPAVSQLPLPLEPTKPSEELQSPCADCKEEPPNLTLSPPATPVADADTSGSTEKDLVIDEDRVSEASTPTKEVEPPKPEPEPPVEVIPVATPAPVVVKLELDVKEKIEVARKIEEIERPTTRKATSAIRPQVLKQNINAITKSFNTNVRATAIGQQTVPEVPNAPLISIDFWENYDPAEVSRTGFGLILSEEIPLKALCFLCGSSGLDEMLFCVCCCEPYHQYCVKDEYNIRHASLDETNISLLELTSTTIVNSSPAQQALNRFNWMCPRCTVCYTCNMATGTKVKCQKCCKNYHTTCLGTSKRLLGADRPMICAACLKCKSCSTTNVTKFIGNLPMCTPCFRLRQKGNFCPLCQRCYEENDFDLKMMECGDCQRWVHAKCEGLTDEQYNMLSALPENIEFICKKCGKNNESANVWRDAVAAEFKAGLLSVVKLLSKSRQACALLKLSPRKKTSNCTCLVSSGKSISFFSFGTSKEESSVASKKPKLDEDSIYDFNSESSSSSTSFPPATKCYCSLKPVKPSDISLVEIKQKINANEYYSLQDFNYDMNTLINSIGSEELSTAYKEFLSETFPWFQNETKACTDALEEAMCGEEMMGGDYGLVPAGDVHLEQDQKVPSIDIPLDEIDDYFYESSDVKDTRICMLCKQPGEGLPLHESRLLYCGQNNWTHTNCALWSAEVFEEIDGSLQNVHSAASRGRLIKCCHCGVKGATVGCNVKNCGEHYHFPCARQINCTFMQDKTVYCPQHTVDATRKKCPVEKSFEINRSVYVELDRRKKKFVEPGKVQFMMGSLSVRKLGHIVPMFSDHPDTIIPTDFECTRLYWSSKEPWKIVEYRIKTTIQNNNYCHGTDAGKNFTVDHTMSSSSVHWGLTQINRWHSSLNNDEQELVEPVAGSSGLQKEQKTMKQLLEAVCGPSDDTNDEEPQNNNDLLPQEIKDAIFEDIPHDILDGISMLDILPKLMTYDDLIAMDLKNENNFNAEILKEVNVGGVGSSSSSSTTTSNSSNATGGTNDMDVDEDDINEAIMKCSGSELSNDGWMKTISAPGIEDALLSAIKQPSTSRDLKRSKSVVRVAGQRSGSFSWNSKLESAAAAKRRKMSKLADVLSLGRMKEDASGSALERRKSLPNEEFSWSANKKAGGAGESLNDGMNVFEKLKISQLDGMDDFCGDAGEMKIYSSNMMEAPVKCDRCHATYRNQESYQRHLNSCEVLSTSESDSETRSPRLLSPEQQQAQVATQLGAGTFILPQTSVAQTISTDMYGQISQNHNGNPTMVISGLNNQTINLNNLGNQAILSNIPASMPITINQLSSGIPIQTSAGTHQLPLQGTLSNLGGNMIISNQGQIFAQPVNFQQTLDNQQGFVQNKQRFQTAQLPQTISLANNIMNAGNSIQVLQQPQQHQQQQQIISIGPNGQPQIVTVTNPNQPQQQHFIQNQSQKKQLIFPSVSPKKPILSKYGQTPTPIKAKRSPPSSTVTNSSKTVHMKKQEPIAIQQAPTFQTMQQQQQQQQQQIQLINTSYPMIRPNSAATPQQATTATAGNQIIFQQPNQPILVQQVGGNQISYVTDQNQVQYLAPTNVLTQNGFTLNTAGDGTLSASPANNILIPNGTGGYSMIPASALQLATAPQPQVIGTIIQPQATSIQCGMMSTEQMVLGATAGTPTLEMVTDPTSGCMYLTSPSVYYGLETIVQNTVMSSQQFVSNAAMHGVLSQNSSFSATTTQVFQASKIEPIVEVPTGYVVLNNDGTTSQLQTSNGIIQQAQIQPAPTPTPNPVVSQPMQTWKIEPQTTFVQQQQQPTVVNPLKSTTGSVKNIIPKTQTQLINKVMPNTMIKTNPEPTINTSMMAQKVSYANASGVYTTTAAVTTTTKVSNVIKPITKTTTVNKPKIVAKPVKQHRQSLLSPQPQLQHQVQQQIAQVPISQPQLVSIKPSINSSDKSLLQPIVSIATNKLNNSHLKNSIEFIPTPSTKSTSLLKKPEVKHFPQRNTPNYAYQTSQAPPQQQPQSIQISAIPTSYSQILPTPTSVQTTTQPQPQKSLLIDKKPSQITMSLASSSASSSMTPSIPPTMSNSLITITPTQTASITLPTAPYPMQPLYSNIPTNVVNPIPQSNNSSNSISNTTPAQTNRPTNRVLPMQASMVLPKSPEVPQTPPPLKLLNGSGLPCDKIDEISIIPSHTVFSPEPSPPASAKEDHLKGSPPRMEIEIKPIDPIDIGPMLPVESNQHQMEEQFGQLEPTPPPSFHLSLNIDHHGSIIPITATTTMSTNSLLPPTIADIEIKPIESTNDDVDVPMEMVKCSLFGDAEDMIAKSMQQDSMDGASSVDSRSMNDESESPEIKNKISEILDNLEAQTNEEEEFSECRESDSSELLLKIEEEPALGASSPIKSQEEQKLVEELNQELQASTHSSPASSIHHSELIIPSIFDPEPKKDSDSGYKENLDPIANLASPAPSTSSNMMTACSEPQQQLPEVLIKMKTCSQPPQPKSPKSNSPKLLYEIQSQDGFTYKSTSIAEIWDKLFEAVQIARKAHGLQPLPEGQLEEMAGVQMLGLKTNAIRYLLEQLPGVEKCTQYQPQYHKKPMADITASVLGGASSAALYADYFDDIRENPYGAARCEPYSARSEYDMFSWLASRHRKQPPMPVVAQTVDDTIIPRRGSGSNLPMAMRYRTLKETSKESVGVYRSHIHGRGLFCNRDIEAGEMVIEYAGELIRSTLTDKRERYYDGRGIGCYMFKIDENFVVDATMRGNAARFINHSCEPNCYSKVVDILGHKHIIIFALRRIVQGEELTYDYKFPFEDVKIPCSCGSKKCRKYLN
ncbi:histone-lysine N-methyltransferase trithorax [Culex pipiens pallens]|uniref:histone-lysine N-methyltransferase trithorax n=1 Tax=Culex pipiens pallens TaxID=42434 RepID=UPI001953D997|nr:histone-lysine N-methyltransferase trithorax [Culex pipiens pallens]